MQIGILANGLRDQDFTLTERLVSLLEDIKTSYKLLKITEDGYTPNSEIERTFSGVDALMIIGGDGTVLRVVEFAVTSGVPMLGINKGHKGFLTDVEPSELEAAVDAVLCGNYNVESRAVLEVCAENVIYHALNDVVISKGENTRPIRLKLTASGRFVDSYTADGLIISTPTGSTAHSLSAGGPILTPEVQGLIINPICAHSLHARPIIVSDSSLLTLEVEVQRAASQIIVDGQCIAYYSGDLPVFVKKSAKSVGFIKFNDTTFYDKLLNKLNYWGVTKV